MPQHQPLEPDRAVPAVRADHTDRVAADELRAAIATARARLLDVLHARARTLSSITTWVGPHRQRYDQDAAELLASGRALDASLRGLLVALDAELAADPTP